VTFLHVVVFLVLVLVLTLVDLAVGRSHKLKQVSVTGAPFIFIHHLLRLRHLQFVKNFGALLVFPLIFSPQVRYVLLDGYLGHCLVAGQLLLEYAALMVSPLPNIVYLVLDV
jgi:hypothetical protein